MLGVVATVAVETGSAAHPVMIDFGDGSAPVAALAGEPVRHEYATPGAYAVSAWPVVWPSGRGEIAVTVKDHAPVVHCYSDPDDDWRCLLWVDEPADGTVYVVDWGDGSDSDRIQRDPPPYPRLPHDYTAEAAWTVTVTDQSTRRSTVGVFDTAGMGVLFQFRRGPSSPDITVTRMRVGAVWELDWGDGAAPLTGTVPASARLEAAYEGAMAPGAYTVVARELVDGQVRRTAERVLRIPNEFDVEMNVAMSWSREHHARTVSVTPYQTPAEQTCTVSWGDGSDDEQIHGGVTAVHTYTGATPETGWWLRVDEDAGPRRRYTRLLAEPSRVGVPHLSAWSRWSGEVVVYGIAGSSNADWYGIKWGDGTPFQDLAAVGRVWNAWHQYPGPGQYAVTVDGPGMAEPVTQTLVVPSYPQPSVTVVEDQDDASRMSARAVADNRDCGGPVVIDWGDGAVTEADDGQAVRHRYAQEGTYTVQVRCVADATARGRASTRVPYGPVSTLAADIGPHPDGSPMHAQITVTAYADKPLVVDWDEGGDPGQFRPPLVDHEYAFSGDYMPSVAYQDGTEAVTLSVSIPFGE